MNDKHILIYQNIEPMVLMEMKHYKCGMVRLKSPGHEVIVSDRERGYLLKLKNGSKSLFIEKDGGENGSR